MIIEFAGDYIDMGDSLEKKQSHLNVACSAWNISILPKKDQEETINTVLQAYREANPLVNYVDNLKHDIILLIQNKVKLFPEIKKTIASGQIQMSEDGVRYSIVVASFRTN